MRQLLVIAVMVMLSGCICCGGKDVSSIFTPQETQTADGQQSCDKPYIQVGSDCCLDNNENGICDGDDTQATEVAQDDQQTTETTETTETTLTQPETTTTQAAGTTATTIAVETTQTTVPTTTTQPAQTNNEGVVMSLSGGWQEFKSGGIGTGYLFRFDEKEGVGQALKYWIEVKTPDGITDKRPISTGESFVDHIRFKVINYGEDTPKVTMRINTEDLTALVAQHPDASLLTIGGQSCFPNPTAMCQRNYKGYKIQLISRFGSGGEKYASVGVTPPGLDMTKLPVRETGVASPDGSLIIGGFFDNTHYIAGGYNLFYVYTN